MESERAELMRDYLVFEKEAVRSVDRVCWRSPVFVALLFAVALFTAGWLAWAHDLKWLGAVCALISVALVTWSGWRAFDGSRGARCPLCRAKVRVIRTSYGYRVECRACDQVAGVEVDTGGYTIG